MSEIPQGSNFGIKPFPRPNWGVQRSRSFLGSPAFYAVDYEEPFRGPLARVSTALGNVAEPDPRIPQRHGPYQPPFPLYPSWYSRNYFPCQPHKDYSLVGAPKSGKCARRIRLDRHSRLEPPQPRGQSGVSLQANAHTTILLREGLRPLPPAGQARALEQLLQLVVRLRLSLQHLQTAEDVQVPRHGS
ncbi:hypothetical protein AAVH_35006, partial [Aphelenchoides avenae]